MKRIQFGLILFAAIAFGQDTNQKTNSFFDDSELRSFALKTILVEGEVENPGPVDVSTLPLRSCPIKEVALEGGKPEFKGAYYYSGYALYDILDGKKVNKSSDSTFSPFVDLYVVVQNDQGEQAVFSWGEIYYSRNNFSILLSKSVQAINPSKMAVTKWPLPANPRLICAGDLLNVRFLSNRSSLRCPYRADFLLYGSSQGLRPGLSCWTLSGSQLDSSIKRHSPQISETALTLLHGNTEPLAFHVVQCFQRPIGFNQLIVIAGHADVVSQDQAAGPY